MKKILWIIVLVNILILYLNCLPSIGQDEVKPIVNDTKHIIINDVQQEYFLDRVLKKEITVQNGRLHGPYKIYNEKGEFTHLLNFKNNSMGGSKEWVVQIKAIDHDGQAKTAEALLELDRKK